MSKHPLVIFTPSGKRGNFAVGTPVLTAARQLGVDLDSVCGGRGICSKCQITPSFGEFPKHGLTVLDSAVSDWNSVEERYKSKRGLIDGRRLGCQATIQGDLVIDVPPESQVHKQVVRKRAEARDIIMDPATRLYYVEVDEPDMHEPSGDLERLVKALHIQWGLDDVMGDLRTLQMLQPALRKGKWKVTCAVYEDAPPTRPRITHVWPGYYEGAIYGLAIDLGSTTIAAHLCDLASGDVVASSGIMNPQIRFGEDLMSRDLIMEAVFVANPVMHHLLLGIDPVELGQAPFALATSKSMTLWAKELDIKLHPDARIYILPCIAGHVGADAAAVALSEAPYQSEDLVLVVDVGTNAELLLGNKEKVLACSSPTGPAFEGAQISSGQRAAPGAIEHVQIDPITKEPRFQVIGSDLWSDDPKFKEAILTSGITGICGSGIIEIVAEMRTAGLLDPAGVIGSSAQTGTDRSIADGRTNSYVVYDGTDAGGPLITVTNKDIREIQLAKAALYAGARLLMDQMGVDHVDRVVLAGAFGAHISPKHAMILGMIPDCPIDKVTSAGNAAGTGARIALLNRAARREIEKTVREIHKIETAIEPKFQEHFVAATHIPNSADPFPLLNALVNLPDVSFNQGADGAGAGRRRRRRG